MDGRARNIVNLALKTAGLDANESLTKTQSNLSSVTNNEVIINNNYK